MNRKLSIVAVLILVACNSLFSQTINYNKYRIKSKEFQDLKQRILIIELGQSPVELAKDIKNHSIDTLYKVSFNPLEDLKKLGKEYEWKFNDSIVFLSNNEINKLTNKSSYAILRLVKHNIYTSYGYGSYSGYAKWYYIPLEQEDAFYAKRLTTHLRFSNYLGMSVPTLGSAGKSAVELGVKMLCHYFNKLSTLEKPVTHHIAFKEVKGQVPSDSIFFNKHLAQGYEKQYIKYQEIIGDKMVFLDYWDLEQRLLAKSPKYVVIQMVSRHTDDPSMLEQIPGQRHYSGPNAYLYERDNKQYRFTLIVNMETGEIVFSYGAEKGYYVLGKPFFKEVKKNIKE